MELLLATLRLLDLLLERCSAGQLKGWKGTTLRQSCKGLSDWLLDRTGVVYGVLYTKSRNLFTSWFSR
jgi:hypothetical protein